MTGTERTGALVNGALIALGSAGIVDALVVHWGLGLHRALPGPSSDLVEAGLLVLSAVLLATGLLREWEVRQAPPAG